MKPTTKTVVSILRRDSRYKRLLETFETASIYNIPREKLIEELKTIHSLREVRRLNIRDPDYVDNLLNANAHDQAQRSRCTEMLMSCVHVTEQLARGIKALESHLLLEYSDQLRQFRTKEERLQVLSIALRKFSSYLDNIKVLHALTELVIADIDKAGWSMRASIDALKITRNREQSM